MSDCCGSHGNHKSGKVKGNGTEKLPKSFTNVLISQDSLIGRWLYNYGKKLEEKDRLKGKHKGGCC